MIATVYSVVRGNKGFYLAHVSFGGALMPPEIIEMIQYALILHTRAFALISQQEARTSSLPQRR